MGVRRRCRSTCFIAAGGRGIFLLGRSCGASLAECLLDTTDRMEENLERPVPARWRGSRRTVQAWSSWTSDLQSPAHVSRIDALFFFHHCSTAVCLLMSPLPFLSIRQSAAAPPFHTACIAC